MAETANGTADSVEQKMVLLDLGSKSKKQVKGLRKGRGKLMSRVEETISQLKTEGELSENSDVVVVVVKQKRKRGWW